MSDIKPTVVDVKRVKPLSFGESYDSRMLAGIESIQRGYGPQRMEDRIIRPVDRRAVAIFGKICLCGFQVLFGFFKAVF